MAAAKEAKVDVVELADKLRQKYGLKRSMEGIYEQVVAFGSLHKRTFNWNDCTFYMSAEHAQAATGSGYPKRGTGTWCRWWAVWPQATPQKTRRWQRTWSV